MEKEILLSDIEHIARAAGALAKEVWQEGKKQLWRTKEDNSPVTDTDIVVNSFITKELSTRYPTIPIVSEEDGASHSEHARMWIVDPIDGTKNFMSGNPYFSVSIALVVEGVSELGVVYMPIGNILYSAARQQGARKNTIPIQPSPSSTLSESRILLDGGSHKETITLHKKIQDMLATEKPSITAYDCASYELCLIAEGVYDAMIHRGLHAWDIAAGICIAKEAGALVSDLRGQTKDLFLPGIIATTPLLQSRLVTYASAVLDG